MKHRKFLLTLFVIIFAFCETFTVTFSPVLAWQSTDFPLYVTSLGKTVSYALKSGFSISRDSDGNLYITDNGNSCVVKFDAQGRFIKTWGSYGTGDDQFLNPTAIDVGSDGYVYVGDYGSSNMVKKFTREGVFVKKWGGTGSTDGKFNYPAGITVKGSTVYVADRVNNRIQWFTLDGDFIGQFGTGGSGPGQFNLPQSIDFDSAGNIYVLERSGDRIQKFDSNWVYIKTWGSAGSGDGQFQYPLKISILNDIIYVADQSNARVQIFDVDGNLIRKFSTTFGGNIWGVEPLSDGSVYTSHQQSFDYYNNQGVRVDSYATTKGTDPGEFNNPMGVAYDVQGNLYVVERLQYRMQKFDNHGNYVQTWQLPFEPCGIATDKDGFIYIPGRSNSKITKYDTSGNVILEWGSPGTLDGQFNFANDNTYVGIDFDSDGNLYVSDTANRRIQSFTTAGVFIRKWGGVGTADGFFGGGAQGPSGLAIDSNDYVYVVDRGNKRVQKFDKTGNFVLKWGLPGNGADGYFNYINGLVIDQFDKVYVLEEQGSPRVQVFTTSGAFLFKFGTAGSGIGQFNMPRSLAITPAGAVAIADMWNNRVQLFQFDRLAPEVHMTAIPNNATKQTDITITGGITDTLTPITSIEYQLDATNGTWNTGNASDGTVDETSENLSLSLTNLSEGEHHLYLRATDSKTNTTPSENLLAYSFTVDLTPPTGSIVIDNGAAVTYDQSVSLKLTATDTFTSVTDMIVSSNPSFAGMPWIPYATSKQFTVTSNAGVKNIFVKYRDAAGNESATYQDSIELRTTQPLVVNILPTPTATISPVIPTPSDIVIEMTLVDASGKPLPYDVVTIGDDSYASNENGIVYLNKQVKSSDKITVMVDGKPYTGTILGNKITVPIGSPTPTDSQSTYQSTGIASWLCFGSGLLVLIVAIITYLRNRKREKE